MKGWVEDAGKLALEARRLERKCAPSTGDEGYREYHADAVVREKTNQKKYKQITHFQAALDNISSTLRNMENDNLDCTYFQNLLEGFETKLSVFKANMAKEYEDLSQMELRLEGDLSTLEGHIDQTMTKCTSSYSKSVSSQARKQQEEVKIRNEKISSHKAEIGAIERKLTALGNRFGGWDPRDHDIFIRVWTQCVGPVAGTSGVNLASQSDHCKVSEKENKVGKVETGAVNSLDLGSKTAHVLRRRLVQAVQMKTEEEIEDHLHWFVEVDALQSRKKEILSMWKRDREGDKPEPTSVISAESENMNHSSRVVNADRKREINKQRLERWQKQKEEERHQKELQSKQNLEEQKKAKERERAERQQSNRVLVQNWVEERKMKEKKASDTEAKSPKVTSANMQSLRLKQEEEINKAKARRKKINTARAASTGRLQRQKEMADLSDPSLRSRVKSKLYEPTKVYLANKLTSEDLEARERQRHGGGAHDAKIVSSGYDLKFTGRAIPAWTRGVM